MMLALLLSLSLTPERPAFREPVIAHIRITNTSATSVNVPLAGEKCGYRFIVVDASTRATLPPLQCRAISNLRPVTIPGNSVFEVALPLSDFVAIPKPGTYAVQAGCCVLVGTSITSNVVTLNYGEVTPLASPAIIMRL